MNKSVSPVKSEIETAEAKKANYIRSLKSRCFLTYSDQTIDQLFKILHSMPSPRREAAFLEFCLYGRIFTVTLH